MRETSAQGKGWSADKAGGPLPKDWTWTYEGGDAWGIRRTPRGDADSLVKWMQAMEQWGSQVATKCRDLEERVRYLESQAATAPASKGGKAP